MRPFVNSTAQLFLSSQDLLSISLPATHIIAQLDDNNSSLIYLAILLYLLTPIFPIQLIVFGFPQDHFIFHSFTEKKWLPVVCWIKSKFLYVAFMVPHKLTLTCALTYFPTNCFHESIILIIIIYHKCLILSHVSLLVQFFLLTGMVSPMGIYFSLPNTKSPSYASLKSQLIFYIPEHTF